jgi:hypothetical protein
MRVLFLGGLAFLFLGLQGLLGSQAFAFDILPEYQGINEASLLKFESPVDIDSEYQIITNAYRQPLAWEKFWQEQSRAMDLTFGSLSNKTLYEYSRIKLDAPLLENLQFRFNYFAQRDAEIQQQRQILELVQRLSSSFSVSAYGTPNFYKRDSDMGFAVLVTPSERWEHRLYYTMHDLVRGDHNDQPDRYTKAPRSVGWTGGFRDGATWARLGVRQDLSTVWQRPQEQRIFQYEKKLAFVDVQHAHDVRNSFGLRLQWDSTAEAQEPDTSANNSVVNQSWRLQRIQARLEWWRGEQDEPLRYGAALNHVQRQWRDVSGRQLQHFNESIVAMASVRGARRADGFDHLQLEYEYLWFSRFGELSLAPSQKNSPHEQRLKVGYEFNFLRNAKLEFALNFDVDEWRTVPTFEGGQGRFRIQL